MVSRHDLLEEEEIRENRCTQLFFYSASGTLDLATLGTPGISPKMYFRHILTNFFSSSFPKLLNSLRKSSKWNRNGSSWSNCAPNSYMFLQTLSTPELAE